MKKAILAITLIAAIVLSNISVYGLESAYITVFSDNFENGSLAFDITEGKTHSNTFDADGTGIGKAYRGYHTKRGNAFPEKIYLLDNCASEGANSFVETEFDVLVENSDELTKGSLRVQLHTSAVTAADPNFIAEFTALVFDFATKKICISGTNAELCDFESNKWYRVKMVIQNTDASAKRRSKVTKVYINGKNMLESEVAFASTNTLKLLYYDRISMNASGTGDGRVYWKMDNISVKKYNSPDGSSPVEDRGKLISLIREGEEILKTNIRLLDDEYKLTEAVEAAKKVYSENDFDNIATEIQKIETCISGISKYSGNLIAYDDFENNSAALFVNGSAQYFDDYKIKTAYSTSAEISRVFDKTYTFSSGVAPWSQEFSCSQMGADCFVETEFDVYFRQLNNMGGKCQLTLTSDVIAQSESTGIVMLTFDGEQGIMKLRSLGEENSEINLGELSDGKWYRIKFLMQITDENSSACKKIAQVYVNGEEKLASPVSFSSTSSHKIPYYNLIKLSGVSNFTGVNGYIDNVAVRRFNGEENVTENTDALLAQIRAAQKRLNAMSNLTDTQAYRWLNAEIENAKNIYESENLTTSVAVAEAQYLSEAVLQSYMPIETVKAVSAVFLDENGNTQPYIKGAKMLSSVNGKNELPVDAGGKCYAIIFNSEGTLLNVKSEDFAAEANSSFKIPMNFDLKDLTDRNGLKLLFWNGEAMPLSSAVITNGVIETGVINDVVIDGLDVVCDVNPRLTYNGDVLVPAENICRILGIDFLEYEESSVAQRIDGKALEFMHNTTEKEAGILLVPMSVLAEEFDINYFVDTENGVLTVNSDFTDNARAASKNEISVKSGIYSAQFSVSYADDEAEAEVWFRMNRDSIVNWTTTAQEAGLNNVLVEDGFSAFVWRKAYTVKYSDGAFRGTIGNLRKGGRYYDVRVRITKNGQVQDEFTAEKLFKTKNDPVYSNIELAPQSESGITLIPTYENIGFYIDADGAASCNVTYCKKGGTTQKSAYTPYYSDETEQFSGSITGLDENTCYTVTAVLYDENDEIINTVTAQTSTWQENPPIAQTVDIDDIYSDGTLVLENIKGTPDGWIKIDCGGKTIDGGKNNPEAIYIYGCKYLILENAVVKGGYRSGINVTGDSEFVRIANMDISGWSREGIFNKEKSLYVRNGVSAGYNGGINLLDTANITVERCYIHDSNAQTNAWSGETWAFVHPSGPAGIVYKARTGLVIRYNDIIGNDKNRWNDGCEAYLNGLRLSGPGFDCDIYGNMITQANDDAFEVDSGGRNLRAYKNRIEHTYAGISTAPLMCGPLYIFRNLMTDIKTKGIKTGGAADGNNGVQYVFNNTVDCANGIGSSDSFAVVTRNNIFASSGKYEANAISASSADAKSSFDYDILRGNITAPEGSEENGIICIPKYESASDGIYVPAKNSYAHNKGVNIPGFDNEVTDGLTDIGAFERGGNTAFLPYRPIDITADKYSVIIKPGETVNVKFTVGQSCSEKAYSVKISESSDWLEVFGAPLKGKLASGSEMTFSLYCDKEKVTSTDEQTTVLFRTDSGYSVPVTIRIDR